MSFKGVSVYQTNVFGNKQLARSIQALTLEIRATNEEIRNMSLALDNANKALVDLNVTADKILLALQTGTAGVPETEVQLLADKTVAINTKLAAGLPLPTP
jgi:hypothetical protein